MRAHEAKHHRRSLGLSFCDPCGSSSSDLFQKGEADRCSSACAAGLCPFPSREDPRPLPGIGTIGGGSPTLTHSEKRYEYLPRGALLPAQFAQSVERCAGPILP